MGSLVLHPLLASSGCVTHLLPVTRWGDAGGRPGIMQLVPAPPLPSGLSLGASSCLSFTLSYHRELLRR